jgi:hypothetical protein
MKNPLLTTLGLAGACAACCAVPLLVPLVSGLSVAGLVGLDWERLAMSREYMAIVVGIAVAFAVALGIWLVRRQRASSACAAPVVAHSSAATQPASSCGCSGPAKLTSTGSSL